MRDDTAKKASHQCDGLRSRDTEKTNLLLPVIGTNEKEGGGGVHKLFNGGVPLFRKTDYAQT